MSTSLDHVARLASLALLLVACQGTPDTASKTGTWSGELDQWGTLREALRDGNDEGRVRIADVAREGVFAVGALADLRGEVTISDGVVWISEGSAQRALTTRGEEGDQQATVLFAAEVDEWHSMPVAEAVDPSVLDAYLEERARAVGLDPLEPFPFVVDGALEHLQLHVIGGTCPMRARMLGVEPEFAPYELHADEAHGRLVGIFAADSSGVVCHAGSRSHVHAILESDGGLTGHVESVGLPAGAILRLPR